jgi:hypothetical protein
MDRLEIGRGCVDWIDLADDRDRWRALVNAVMNLRVLENEEEVSSGYRTCRLSSSAQLHTVSLLVAVRQDTAIYSEDHLIDTI